MSYFGNEAIKFLRELRENNNKDWFHENKKLYVEFVRDPFKSLIEETIFMIQDFDNQLDSNPKSAIFRINRDLRFTKDKSPYKTHVSANMTNGKRSGKNIPGYYLEISADRVMIGGGVYFLDKHGIQSIREAIRDNIDEFNNLINANDFKEKFGDVKGDKNKRIPVEFKDIAISQPLIANKNWYFMTELPVEIIFDEALVFILEEHYKIISKFTHFFRKALL